MTTTTPSDRTEKIARDAFEAGAMAVHREWVAAAERGNDPPRGDPEFGEAASDYARSILASVPDQGEAVAWQWRYVGDTEWLTSSGGKKISDAELKAQGRVYFRQIEQRPLYAAPLVQTPQVSGDVTIPSSENMDARFDWLQSKAVDMGYMLVPEKEHPDSPHAQFSADHLCEHWLQSIVCNHEAKTDRAVCWCGWTSDERPNVGSAVRAWAEHVLPSPPQGDSGTKS